MVRAIAAVAHTREQAATLVTIAFYENTLDASRGVPLGMCSRLCAVHCTRCHVEPLRTTVRHALHVLRRGRRQCSTLVGTLAYFHHGTTCAIDDYSQREAHTVARLLAAR